MGFFKKIKIKIKDWKIKRTQKKYLKAEKKLKNMQYEHAITQQKEKVFKIHEKEYDILERNLANNGINSNSININKLTNKEKKELTDTFIVEKEIRKLKKLNKMFNENSEFLIENIKLSNDYLGRHYGDTYR